MTELTYMCENCLEPHIFSPLDENSEYKCPEKMLYWGTQEIDPDTNKVIRDYVEPERKQANPGNLWLKKTQVTCLFCQSTNVRKIVRVKEPYQL